MLSDDLISDTLNFCNSLIDSYDQLDEVSAKNLQLNYLLAQAMGCVRTFKSYLILRKNKCSSDAKILLRTLLERMGNSFYAILSEEKACELGAREYNLIVEQIERWIEHDIPSEGVMQTKAETLRDLAIVEGFLSDRRYKSLTIAKVFYTSKLQFIKKGAYANYCNFVHPTIDSAITKEQLSEFDDYISLITLLECSMNFHKKVCIDDLCTKPKEYLELAGRMAELIKE